MTTTPTGVPLDEWTASQVANPELPTGGTMNPVLMANDDATLQSTGQLMNGTGSQIPGQTPVTQAAPVTVGTVTPQQGTAAQVDPTAATSQINPAAGQYQATLTGGQAAQGTAAQGTVDPKATVQGQLTDLYSQTTNGQTPTWAKGAVRKAEELMAARGMGASSIGATAITAAVQASALPIASQDASTYFQMDLANLSNKQQMELVNLQNRQQSLLSDQAADNASKQFNASSASQTQQFMATLISNIQTQNADRFQAMSQFNVGQANSAAFQNIANQINVSEFNSQQKAAIDQFNAQQTFARDQFNAQQAFAIEQSNVLWRRNINTENTATINAANQVNVQNAFNLSQTAQNQLWQMWRDDASYAFTASENALNRDFNAAQAANNRTSSAPEGFNWGKAAGAFASGLFI